MVESYDDIKKLKKQLDSIASVSELLALHRSNDPFYIGTKGQREKARWFTEVWQRFGYDTGVHLRRIHYQLISQDDPRLYNGDPYRNTESCWNNLIKSAKFARHLGYIDADRLEDRRNPDPILTISAENISEPSTFVDYFQLKEWNKPEIQASLKEQINWELPEPEILNFDYSAAEQPYYIELWIEKSTMNDVLEPICREYGINLIIGEGFQSITSTVKALKRINELGKPARIFYISDFDPAGKGMPIAVARQIEFYRKQFAEGVEVKLEPIALLLDQVKQYELPRTPIKDSDNRKEGFESEYGEGAVELDALEALYPGELKEIVEDHAKKYRDFELQQKFREAEKEYKEKARQKWKDKINKEIDKLESVQQATTEILERYKVRLNQLNEELQRELQPLMEKLESVQQATTEKAIEFYFNDIEKPEGQVNVGSETGFLFDSNRDYLEQLDFYKNNTG